MEWYYDEQVQTGIVIRTHSLLGYEDNTPIYKEYFWTNIPIVLDRGDNKVLTYDCIIEKFPSISSSLESDSGSGTLVLQNYVTTDVTGAVTGTHLDDLLASSIEGRGIKVYLVDITNITLPDFEDATAGIENQHCIEIYRGIVDSLSGTETKVNITLKNYVDILNNDLHYKDEDFITPVADDSPTVPIVVNNSPKPFCYGECFNITPRMINAAFDDGTITGSEYLIDSEQVYNITQVRENGNPLDNSVTSTGDAAYLIITGSGGGNYGEEGVPSIEHSGSIVLVNGDPTSGHGTITCDITGKQLDKELSISDHTRPRHPITISLDMVKKAFKKNTLTGIEDYIDIETFNNTEILIDSTISTFPSIDFHVGMYITEVTSALTAIQELLASVRCYLYINNRNKICVDRFELYDYDNFPDRKPRYVIVQDQVILGSMNISSIDIPNTRVDLKYKKNYTIQPPDSLAFVVASQTGEAADKRKEEFATEHSTVVSENTYIEKIENTYPTAIALEVSTLLVRLEGAEVEANARMSVRNRKRKMYSLKVYQLPITMRVGDWVTIYHFLFSDDSGVINGTIISMSMDLLTKITNIEVFV